MPWLEKDNTDDPSKNLLFVHVPRCGGTSLMKSHNVPCKATQNADWYYNKIGMRTYFHRYGLLETTNFPIWTGGNAVCWLMALVNAYLRFVYLPGIATTATSSIAISSTSSISAITIYKAIASFNIAFFITLFIGLTFVFVAPTVGRMLYVRRFFLLMVQYGMCGAMECVPYLTGANVHGYINHLTADKMIRYGYVSSKEMKEVSSLAIVRNPYSRMISIYMYNRFGSKESFRHFIYSWYRNMKFYRDSREMEDWYTPSHVIPQFEYTHTKNGSVQLVRSIVKQEELKYLKQPNNNNNNNDWEADDMDVEDSSVRDLPPTVRDALLNMPHDNKRSTGDKRWYEYYDQDTLNLTYEMYRRDFDMFRYPTTIPERPDLHEPPSIPSSPIKNNNNNTFCSSSDDDPTYVQKIPLIRELSVATVSSSSVSSSSSGSSIASSEGTSPLVNTDGLVEMTVCCGDDDHHSPYVSSPTTKTGEERKGILRSRFNWRGRIWGRSSSS